MVICYKIQTLTCSRPIFLWLQVKIKNWVNGDESASLDGLSARFGASLPTSVSKALRLPAILANPFNSCNKLSSKLSNSFVVAERGDCTYATKAEIAESSDLTEMVCTKNETHLNITIPVVMIPKSAGDYLRGSMSSSGKVDILLYSPTRPILDISVVFLVLMAVGTIVSASFWDEFTAHEQVGEHYNQSRWKQDQPSAETNQEDTEKNTLKIKAVGAIAFVIVASGMHFCIVSLISRASKHCRQMKINIPIIGKVSVIAIVVLPFCIAFSIIWVGNRHSPHAWIGQDILVS
ncbi:signal peptide peptidase-like [Musa troglodytarum]|uniref:Signal peptide peptidase-like n=1 Tax=Musa troglodytarum TaxID=320322 RepID=A0A9E7F197_9LILI|nr:signal peptide peptidase-like [Musa troglodytarum]